MKPWRLSEVKYSFVKDNPYQVAVLPIGATEPHNLHMPYGTDAITVGMVGDAICEEAHKQGANVALLPTIPYGVDTNLLGFPMAMSINPSTLDLLITDLVNSLETHGVHKLVILNGHGGNSLKHTLRELFPQTSVFISLIDWYAIVKDVYFDIFENPDDHAGEMETSIAMHWFPELVDVSLADSGSVKPSTFEAINKGWVQVTRPWDIVTTNSGVGDPRQASADKGKQVIEVLKERLATYIKELSDATIDESFPYEK